jgi:CBS domain-containing protein
MARNEEKKQEQGTARRESVRDVMTSNPETVKEKDSIREVARLMVDQDCGAVPVVAENGRKVVGMITDRDIVVRVVAEGKDVKGATVSDAMSRGAKTVREDAPLNDVMLIMSREQIRRVAVVDQNDELVGIVAVADIAQETNHDRKLGETVSEISEPVQSVR